MNPSNVNGQRRYFMVKTDFMAVKIPDHSISSSNKLTEKGLDQGTLLEEVVTSRHDRIANLHKQRQVVAKILNEKNQTLYAVDLNRMINVSEEDAQVLMSVPVTRERPSILSNKDFLNEMKSIKEGSKVHIRFDDSNSVPAIVLRKEFDRSSGFRVKVIFFDRDYDDFCSLHKWMEETHDNCYIVPLIKLRLIKDQESDAFNIGSKVQQRFSGNQKNQAGQTKAIQDEFVLNERVVWFHNGQYLPGSVCYLGCPNEKERCVGVKFDSPVKNNLGQNVEVQFFTTTKNKKGLYTAIAELKREKDINQLPVSGSSKSSPSKTRKKKDSNNKPANTATFYDENPPLPEKTLLTTVNNEHTKSVHSLNDSKGYENIPKLQGSPQSTFGKSNSRGSEDYTPSPLPRTPKSSPPISSERNKNFPNDGKPQTLTKVYNAERYSDQNSTVTSGYYTGPKKMTSGSLENLPGNNQFKQPSVSPLNKKRLVSTPEYAEVRSKVSNNSENMQIEPRNFNRNRDAESVMKTTLQSRYHDDLTKETKRPYDEVMKDPYRSQDLDSLGRNRQYEDSSSKNASALLKAKFLEEKHPDLRRDDFKKPASKTSESTSQKSRDAIMNFDVQQSDIHLLKSPDSPDVNDFYHVVSDECEMANESRDITDPHDMLSELDRQLSLTSTDFGYRMPGKEIISDLDCGSVVEVMIQNEPWYGVIRWIGEIEGTPKRLAGIEMEDEHAAFGNGVMNGREYFKCPPGKGLFVFLHLCKKDGRFQDSMMYSRDGKKLQAFGSMDCPAVGGDIPPMSYDEYLHSQFFKKNRGIQGHHNSCYLDATLFSMFAFTSVFDNLLNRPRAPNDIDCYEEVQRVLKEEIVNPLRRNLYVRADRVMKLRTLLEKLSSVSGLTSEEKDPEEFLNSLLHQILKAEPYLKLSSGQEAYFYQLFVEKNDQLRVPTVQQLFDQSFLTSDLKLKEVPSCLIIQMPRHGKQFKMYNRIFPSPVLDITDILENSPRQCFVCGEVAELECRDCFYRGPDKFTMKALCNRCSLQSHSRRSNHELRQIKVPPEFLVPAKTSPIIPRIQMELFAVVCIETSHYVAFVKCGDDADVPWSFFDSMADRKGEQNGYNIPEVSLCTELSEWLSERGFVDLEKDPERALPDSVKRLFGDAYLCMYQSSAAMMYH